MDGSLYPEESVLWQSAAGKALSPVYVRQMVKRYGERAGLEKDVHRHTLRHTAATT